VRGGRATLPEGGSLAGSTLTMDRAVANCVRLVRAPLATAVGLATAVPARVLGLADRKGLVEPGYDADLAILDAALAVTGTLVGGRWRHRA
jgi:N-acetylglucosamine-6-phosphate deacetylase